MQFEPERSNALPSEAYGPEGISNSSETAEEDMKGKSVAERKDWLRREYKHVLRDN